MAAEVARLDVEAVVAAARGRARARAVPVPHRLQRCQVNPGRLRRRRGKFDLGNVY